MRALVVEGGQVRYEAEYHTPKPGAEEVLVKVELAGICSTDLEIIKGYMDYRGVMGHEMVGTVAKGTGDLAGKRVVAEINRVCGKCDMCLSGLSNHCRNRSTMGIKGWDGCFAEYVVVPKRNIHVVPNHVSNDQAVLVEPLAAAFQIVQQIRIESRDKVIVLGDGRLGLLVAQVLNSQVGPNRLTLLGKHENKLTFAEKRGIRTAQVSECIIRPEWDLVVDCTGKAEGFEMACQLVRPRGTLVLKSTFHAEGPVDLAPLVINEVKLVGSRCGPFATAVNALATNQIETNGIITSRFGLNEANAAFEKARRSDQIKVVFDLSR